MCASIFSPVPVPAGSAVPFWATGLQRGMYVDVHRVGKIMSMFTDSTSATVDHLLTVGGPADIARFVVPIVVDPVDAVLGSGSRSDVVVESLEVVDPFVADSDAPATVRCPTLMVWPEAPFLHPLPGSPFSRTCETVRDGGLGERASQFAGTLGLQAATGATGTGSQLVAPYDSDGSTVAAAFPAWLMGGSVRPSDDCPAGESLSGQVDESPHTCYSTLPEE